jgi:hypothetical protein
MLIKFYDLYVKRHDNHAYIPIKDHPYYRSLLTKNQGLYEGYVIKSFYQYSKPTGRWCVFYDLYKKIKDHGYNFCCDPIVIKRINGMWVCVHGKHRICILYHIFGPYVLMKIIDSIYVGSIGYNKSYDNILTFLL